MSKKIVFLVAFSDDIRKRLAENLKGIPDTSVIPINSIDILGKIIHLGSQPDAIVLVSKGFDPERVDVVTKRLEETNIPVVFSKDGTVSRQAVERICVLA